MIAANDLGRRILEVVGGQTTCSCGQPSDGPHKCPYQDDVHNNPDPYCDCCDDCEQNCVRDV